MNADIDDQLSMDCYLFTKEVMEEDRASRVARGEPEFTDTSKGFRFTPYQELTENWKQFEARVHAKLKAKYGDAISFKD